MTDDLGLALDRIEALARVSFPLGSSHKRFARNLAGRDNSAALTEKQKRHVARLAWRYRRQMPAHLVPPENPDAPEQARSAVANGAKRNAAGTPATQSPTAQVLGWPGAEPSAAPPPPQEPDLFSRDPR